MPIKKVRVRKMTTAIEHLRLFFHIRKFIADQRLVSVHMPNGERIEGVITRYDDSGITLRRDHDHLVLVRYDSILAIEWSEDQTTDAA